MPNYSEKIHNTSEVMKALAHPARVCIVSKLRHENLNVNQMQDCLDISQSNVSQHLNVLKRLHIIEGKRNGTEIIYSLVDEHVSRLVDLFFDK
jgi:ArsR family transcriptional regulator